MRDRPIQHPAYATPPVTATVGPAERAAALAGAVMAGYLGLLRPPRRGALLGLVSGILAYRAISGYCPYYARRGSATLTAGVDLHTKIVIERPLQQVLRYWSTPDHLPRFHRRGICLQTHGTEARWLARGPLGNLYWGSRLAAHANEQRVSWQATEDSAVRHYGEVILRPAAAGTGTECEIRLSYHRPTGLAATAPGSRILRAEINRIKDELESRPADSHPHGVPDQGLGRQPVTPSHG